MSFISITEKDKKEMFDSIGINDIDDLFLDIPDSIRIKDSLNIPSSLSEIELTDQVVNIASQNKILTSFLGAGAYPHHIPAVVDDLTSRSEFYTAYTPYQPEVSQGTLTAIFEFQTFICRLTGMDIANASMYDGATSLVEAAFMSARSNKKNKFLVSTLLDPKYRSVLDTYSWASDIELVDLPFTDGIISLETIVDLLDDSISGIIIQNPNYFGNIEEVEAIPKLLKNLNINLIIAFTEPMSLGLLKPPGEQGADIVCGEAQGFGNPIGFGGPMLGILAVNKKFMRSIPGRLVGMTTDQDGNEAYVLTLQTREQHIRRERATSNICSNQGLCALRAVIYLSLLGNKLRDVAIYNHKIALYLKTRLIEKGFKPIFDKPFFNEFILSVENAEIVHEKLLKEGYALGMPLSNEFNEMKNSLLICATELNSKESIDKFIDVMKNIY